MMPAAFTFENIACLDHQTGRRVCGFVFGIVASHLGHDLWISDMKELNYKISCLVWTSELERVKLLKKNTHCHMCIIAGVCR